jgi:putative ABC transport system ATP-binding protein
MTTMTSDLAVAARMVDVTKVYGTREETRVNALGGVRVGFHRGRFMAIMGPSGSGKSTLLHCLSGPDRVTSGEVWLGDTRLDTLNDRGLTRFRQHGVGFMFQQFNLLPTLTAEENILLPLAIAGRKPEPEWRDRIIQNRRARRPPAAPAKPALRRRAAAGGMRAGTAGAT